MRLRRELLLAAALLLPAVGCGNEAGSPTPPPASPPASVTLRIAVAEDTLLADAIRRLRGEWSERSDVALVVESVDHREVLSGEYASQEFQQPPDLLIFASRHLGELCEAKRLRPVRKSVLRDGGLRVSDFFPLVRERLMVFGGETMALPVGCVAPAFFQFQEQGELPPRPESWKALGDQPVFPLTFDELPQAAYHLLARAACYATHSSRSTLLFDPESMAPRLLDPPFVRALAQLATADSGKRGTGMAIAWPLRQDRGLIDNAEESSFSALASPLPGAEEVYNPAAGAWEPIVGEPRRVPLLATSGRLIGASADSRNAASAFRFVAWLVGPQNARQLSTVSANVANPRKSLALVADDWSGEIGKELGKQFAAAQAASLSRRQALLIPRIIRIDDYLAALNAGVERAISGEATPEQALQQTADAWERLTDKIGRERQRRCYQGHLQGLGE